MIRVLIADSSSYLRDNLVALLSNQKGITVVGVAPDDGKLMVQAERLAPDLALIDAQLPGSGGVAATSAIKKQWPTMGVLLLSVFADPLQAGARAGADGCLFKDCSLTDLVREIRRIHSRLREREAHQDAGGP
jgi:two-component system, NarL family, response regulator DesR